VAKSRVSVSRRLRHVNFESSDAISELRSQGHPWCYSALDAPKVLSSMSIALKFGVPWKERRYHVMYVNFLKTRKLNLNAGLWLSPHCVWSRMITASTARILLVCENTRSPKVFSCSTSCSWSLLGTWQWRRTIASNLPYLTLRYYLHRLYTRGLPVTWLYTHMMAAI
jgi:hypothetical protein